MKWYIAPLEFDEIGPHEGRDEERQHESRDGSVGSHCSPPDFGQQGLSNIFIEYYTTTQLVDAH